MSALQKKGENGAHLAACATASWWATPTTPLAMLRITALAQGAVAKTRKGLNWRKIWTRWEEGDMMRGGVLFVERQACESSTCTAKLGTKQ